VQSPNGPADQWSDLDRPPLDVRGLRRALRVGEPGSWWCALSVVESTDSTNADLAAAVRSGRAGPASGASVLAAEHQRSGRGRLGRHWEAPARSALTVSVLVHPDVETPRWAWLPLLTGVAVAEAVRAATGLGTSLKWPNDVLVGERKLAGVLLERVEQPVGGPSRPAAVLGIGLNVSTMATELPVPTATSLAVERASTLDRQTLLVAVLRTLETLYAAWAHDGVDAGTGLHTAYVRRCGTLGRQVQVTMPDGTVVAGTAETVDAGGRLVLATPTGRRMLGAGDVVHVRPYDRSPAGEAF